MMCRAALSSVVVVVLLALAGCSAAEDAVKEATDEATQDARNAAGNAVNDAVRSRVCKVVQDRKVSESEIAVLRAAVAGAEGAGLPQEVTAAAREVIGSGGEPSADAVKRLDEACAASGSPAGQ